MASNVVQQPFTTRNLFDALFDRYLPAGAALTFNDDDDNADAGIDVAAAAVLTEDDEKNAGAAVSIAVEHDDAARQQYDVPSSSDDTVQPWLSLDADDIAVLEAQALGTDDVEASILRAEEAAAQRKAQLEQQREAGAAALAAGSHGSSASHGPNQRGPANAHGSTTTTMTAEEQLHRMPVDGPEVFSGVCVLFNHGKGFGFIAPDVGGPDVYYTREGIGLSFSRSLDAWLGAMPASEEGVAAHTRQRLERGLRLLQLSRPFLVGGERVAFRVSSNAQGGGGGGGGGSSRRKLRAVDITAPNGGPITIERVLLCLVRGGAPLPLPPSPPVGETGGVTADGATEDRTVALPYRVLPPMEDGPDAPEPLHGVRYCGWVKNLSCDGDRGYIRPDPAALSGMGVEDTAAAACSLDAVLHMDVVVWASHVPIERRVLEEGVLVEYSVVGFDKNRKPVAAVVTGPGDMALDPRGWALTEVAKRRKAEADAGGGYDDEDGSGGARRSDGGALRNKRGRGEDHGDSMMLLLDEDGGGYV